MKGQAYGWEFIAFTIIFYCFIAFLLSMGADKYLITTLPNYSALTNANFFTLIWTLLVNPFTVYGFLAWLGLSFAVIDITIIFLDTLPEWL